MNRGRRRLGTAHVGGAQRPADVPGSGGACRLVRITVDGLRSPDAVPART